MTDSVRASIFIATTIIKAMQELEDYLSWAEKTISFASISVSCY